VDHGALLPEALAHGLHHLVGKRDLGHQVDDAASFRQRGFGRLQEYFGLARSRGAVQVPAAGCFRQNRLERVLLFVGRRDGMRPDFYVVEG